MYLQNVDGQVVAYKYRLHHMELLDFLPDFWLSSVV